MRHLALRPTSHLIRSLLRISYSSQRPGLELDAVIPLLFVISKEDTHQHQATNHMRACAAAALRFFEVLDEPFYLLSMSGGGGKLSIAMYAQLEAEQSSEPGLSGEPGPNEGKVSSVSQCFILYLAEYFPTDAILSGGEKRAHVQDR